MPAKKKDPDPTLYHVKKNFSYEAQEGEFVRVNRTVYLNGLKADPIPLDEAAVEFGESIDAIKKA